MFLSNISILLFIINHTGAWTLPAVDTVEGLTKIKTGRLYTLSVQEILDCDGGGHGCDGGFTDKAFEFIKQHGLTTESNYPSKGSIGTCDTKKEAEPVTKISGYENVPVDNERALLQAVANQPVAVSVDASGADFQFYTSGVFSGKCGAVLDHGVTVIGYGTSNGKLKYWLIKNSWGTSWGEILLLRKVYVELPWKPSILLHDSTVSYAA